MGRASPIEILVNYNTQTKCLNGKLSLFLNIAGYNVLTIHMQDWYRNNQQVVYSYFKLQDPTYFRLSIGRFRGNVSDSMSYSNNMRFATYDSPDPNNCSTHQHAGWWYNYCAHALLNGKYYNGSYTPTGRFWDGTYWEGWLGFGYSLKFVSMALSSNEF